MKFPILQALAVLAISAPQAQAWNAHGHMIVAAVAWVTSCWAATLSPAFALDKGGFSETARDAFRLNGSCYP